MFKSTIIVILSPLLGVILAPTANAGPFCDIMDQSPTVSQATKLIYATAVVAYDNGVSSKEAASALVSDIKSNCPQYAGIMLQASQNYGG